MADIPNFYWDTCVFIAHLNDARLAYASIIDDIGQYLDEAKRGECRIHCSAITIAEVTKKNVTDANKGRFNDFLRDFAGVVIPFSPDPNVMALASELRSLPYTKSGGRRELGTPDAIHLASAIILTETFKVPLTAFHTFDDGKSRGLDGRSVPLLSYQDWCEECKDDPLAQKVIKMTRTKPEHPNRKLQGF